MGTYIRLTDYKSSDEKERGFFDPKNRYEAKQEDFFKIPGSPIAYWVSDRVREIFEKSEKLGDIVKYTGSLHKTANNDKYLRFIWEINANHFGKDKWIFYNKGGSVRKWFGNNEYFINWFPKSRDYYKNHKTANLLNENFWYKTGVTWSALTSGMFNGRFFEGLFVSDFKGSSIHPEKNKIYYILAFTNSKIANDILSIIAPTIDYNIGQVIMLPIIFPKSSTLKSKIDTLTQECIDISKEEWDSRETSWDFRTNELVRMKSENLPNQSGVKSIKLEDVYNAYCEYWREKFYKLHKNEEELNKLFIEIYGLEDELTPDVPLEDITILKKEAKIVDNELVFDKKEIMKQFISYAVGVMFGRYSLNHNGLHIANMNEGIDDANLKFNIQHPTFEADDDNIIPVLEDDYFKDDIASRFVQFVKTTFGEENLNQNINFIESSLGMTIRKYFIKSFYEDHIKRYKKRPIYWMVSSLKKGFMALIYMHRYKPDIFARLQRLYLHEYINKLESVKSNAKDIENSDIYSQKDKIKATKRIKKIDSLLRELMAFDRDKLDRFAKQLIEIDLDDGVRINYCKFKDILYPISGLCKK